MSNAPTLINLPPPPSDPVTPSDVPSRSGTPNSTTTSMSELSTVAIKDGHRGHLPHHHANPLDAERADRISRLAGLERVGVSAGRPMSNLNPTSGSTSYSQQAGASGGTPTQGYFDANNQPAIMRERSTVGSASATGSVGGRTTWASGSDMGYDPSNVDKMSEDQDVETSSMGGFSDEGAGSLVGFGEGARTPARQASQLGSPVVGKASASAVPPYMRGEQVGTPMSGVTGGGASSSVASTYGGSATGEQRDARMIDGMTYDHGVVDTVTRTPPPARSDEQTSSQQAGSDTAEQWMRRQEERAGEDM
ncbi:hypothetical protein K490DRAFT_66876 [Saccharata proteae CBS 121410]|uniref:Uncharacterized protein n=1 Tax=Saccharata proteae CBS 121410 TaxID=1314787 RepID=A0A9P4LWD1_9PEZI|nr:hypothetical protein K490DRAFT_66876 [Saccharata proteae CBS 121410]